MVAALVIEHAPAGMTLDIRAVGQSFELDGQPLPVLDEVSFRVDAGEFVALIGPSGCGKSSLLRLVAGLDRPTGGVIVADDQLVIGPDPSRILMFQDPTLFPWRTVRENVALGPEARGLLASRRQAVDEALRLVGLAGFAGALPHQLSGGMAQRAALARALVNQPRLLILDEPLGKLDSLTRLAMQTELVRIWQQSGITTMLVTHDIEEALYLAQRVLVFSERPGRIKAEVVVDRPYPRHRGDPHLADLRHHLLQVLGLDDSW
jgi:NitT/TauT family transport system ATP-binding protein